MQYSVDAQSLDNEFIHATNHSVQSKAEGFCFEDCACTMAELEERLIEAGHAGGQNAKENIFRQMVTITKGVFSSVESSRKKLFTLPECFELYGFDFMVSDDMNVWVLEVNASPDISLYEEHYRHLAKGLVDDIVALAVDPYFPPHPKCAATNKGFVHVMDMLPPDDCAEAVVSANKTSL